MVPLDSTLPLVFYANPLFLLVLGHAIGHVGRGGIVSSRNIRIEDSNIRTETEPLTERLDCVDRAPIRWGWRRGLREQREAGGACGTLFFSHPPTPSRVFVFDIVHNIVARGS